MGSLLEAAVSRRMMLVMESSVAGVDGGGTLGGVEVRMRSIKLLSSWLVMEGERLLLGLESSSLVVLEESEVDVLLGDGDSP